MPTSTDMKPLLSLFALALAGCIATPRVETPAADASAPAGAVAPMPRTLGADDSTRKTTELLAAAGANKLDGLKPMDHSKMSGGGMEGMDHSKMPGMKGGGDMQGMDHSKMPGMKSSGMKGMDHSKMPGMKDQPRADQTKLGSMEKMPGMDHSKMPGMKPGAAPAKGEPAPPADAAATAEEMKKTADEMKKASDEMKAKSDALQKSRGAKPGATPAPKAGDHSQHQP
ncbi:MAG: hypothetical protein ABIZ56_06945 [Chthoniobacteraceae bacterium]